MNTAYEVRKERAARIQAEQSRKGRDIGDIPPPANAERKDRARGSFEYFLRTYFPETFYLPWSEPHRRVIEGIEHAVLDGGLFAYAMPRGSGKTSITERAPIWATSFGYRNFPVLIGSDQDSALEMLDTIKSELENNELLAEDFPEICYPIRALEGVANRASGQLCNGERTQIYWASEEIILPTIKDSPASGAIIKTTGITGRLRGMKAKRSDGRDARPDFALLDDPQTDESARSPSQCVTRLRIVRGAVLGLAGPGKRIAAVMPCTVISPGDLADNILNRAKHPEWRGERSKLMLSFPTNLELWEKYRGLRADSLRAGNNGREATEFYRANREEMDHGAQSGWPVRHNPDEASAIQHAMNLRFDLGEAAFQAEYQNDPLPEVQAEPDALTVDAICARVNGRARGTVPIKCTRVVAHIDCQKALLPWLVLAVDDEFNGAIIDYGTFPDQQREFWTLKDARRTLQWLTKDKSLEGSLRTGLDLLIAELAQKRYRREDGAELRIEKCPIDSNWETDLVFEAVRASPHRGIVLPSLGVYVGATSRPFSEWRKQPGDRVGLNWRYRPAQNRGGVWRLEYDTNAWKGFVQSRFQTPIGSPGAFTIFGDDPRQHELLANHFVAEVPHAVTSRGRTVIEYTLKPSRPDNHHLDNLVAACAAASMQGSRLPHTEGRAITRSVVKLSELQKQRRVHHARGN